MQTIKNMKQLLSLVAWILFLPFMPCSASSFFFHTVDVKDGLADNFVRDVVCDSKGYIWISTINGLSRYDGYRFFTFMPQHYGGDTNDVTKVRETADSTLWMVCGDDLYTYIRSTGAWRKDGAERLAQYGIKGKVRAFYVDDQHNLWVVSDNALWHYDYARRKTDQVTFFCKSPITHVVSRNGYSAVVTSDFKIYKVELKERKLMAMGQVPAMTYNRDMRVYLDNSMNLWVYNSHSLAGTQWLFSFKTRQWRQMQELRQMGDVLVNAIAEDNEGNLWVGTGNAGIHLFKYNDGGMAMTKEMSMKAFTSRSSHITCFYLDGNNTMWVGSAKLGVAFTDMSRPSFDLVGTDGFEDVSSLLLDRKGNLWIGFDGEGVMMKSATGGVTSFSDLHQQLPSNIVTSLVVDAHGGILAGTYGNGIAKLEGARFLPFHPECPHLRYTKAMAVDTHGHLWVATVENGVVKVDADGKTYNYTTHNSPLVSNGTLCLAVDSLHDIMYIGTSMGVSAYDCAKGRFIDIEPLKRLKGAYVSSMMVCNCNMLWVGSRDGLWGYRFKDETLVRLTTEQGMSHNTVRALAKSGNCVWASTDNGLTCITMPENGESLLACKCFPFFDSDGLDKAVFSNNAALTTADGTVLLGCYAGYVRILPENIVAYHPPLNVRFTSFRVNEVIDARSLAELTVRHDDRLAVAVSAMVPVLSRKVKFLYRFKGEKGWIRSSSNIIQFVSLKSGRRVLQVKAELPGIMESAIAELPITVRPPIWLSWPALLLYLLLLASAVYTLYKSSLRRQKRELALKQMEVNLKKYEMEEEKIRFFTNISHDLKTPLTLVVAPLEKMRQAHLPDNIRTDLDVAWRNARQLYELILQLLDFSRLDVGKERLNLKSGDIVSFVRQTVQGFTYYATTKHIQMQMDLPATSMEIDFDENKMRRVITNLLSNAYKYNTDNGSVTVTLSFGDESSQRQMVLSVADTGIGISDKRHIFGRFVQETHGQEQEGSGLGLHIVKHYVHMMGGSITVADNIPKGTIFTVTLPVVEVGTSRDVEPVDTEGTDLSDTVLDTDDVQSKPTVMVVDDNKDARLFLQRSLDDEYHVLVAENGKDALQQLAQNDTVALVVSDVMMPVMDGLQLFKQLKGNIRYSHIPVILLTAKSSEENIVAGLKEGAADYITKPFSLAVLRLRIKKVLEWTQLMHDRVANGIEIKPSEITVSSLDEELIGHVISNIEANIQDINYSVVQLSSAVGMTRGHLYKKLMAITGKSPLEFMRIIKLKRGKSLLDQGKTNISEVSDMVGLSPKQFAHYFKLMYGDTPSEYLKKRKSQNLT